MRLHLPLILLTLAAGPALAQQHDDDHAVAGSGVLPAGWMARTDGGRPMTALKFDVMTPGWHLTTGPAVILYRDADKVDGLVHAITTINVFPASGHAEGFGLFLGGQNLQADNQSYTYFLIRGDGMYLVKRRTGATTSTVVDWTASDAIKKASADGPVANEISLQTSPDSVAFMVNGTTVATLPSSQLDTKGIVGLRVNHNLNLHVSSLGVHPLH
ncbi:MAG TPA: hypothetical protein VGP80_07435 [Gemmatimonadales bacterium]|jgi:hypothetical protein|nr:hypothetical protein [Gemmatimonadales bacterium]